MSLTFRRLAASDEAAVRGWLHAYLVEHVEWWLQARGLEGDAPAVVRGRALVDRDWAELIAAAATALLLVAKAWKWLLFDVVRWVIHPGRSVGWLGHHWHLALALTAGFFLVAFASARLGLDWMDRLLGGEDDDEDDAQGRLAVGPGWAERPPDRSTTLPPRMG